MKLFKQVGMSVFVVSVLFVLCSGFGTMLQAQQAEKPSEEEQKMMKLWMDYATPGPSHKYLEYFVGEWDVSTKMWMKAGDEPMVTQSEAKSGMILGGRFLKSHYKGTMMGMPFEGIALTGYDNLHKKYVSIWFDSMGTGFYQTSGTVDKTGKIRTETGLWDNIMTGGKSKVKLVTKIIDDNQFLFEMYGPDPKSGKIYKTGEMVYKKKK